MLSAYFKDDAQTIVLKGVRRLIHASEKADVHLVIPYSKKDISTPLDSVIEHEKVVKYLIANSTEQLAG